MGCNYHTKMILFKSTNILYFRRIRGIGTSPSAPPLEGDPASCTESAMSTKKVNFVSKLNCLMRNKAGKGARNGHRGDGEHHVKENKPLDGDCSSLERVCQKEMSFSGDGEKNNGCKGGIAPYLASESHPSDVQEPKDSTSPLSNSVKHEEEHCSYLAQSISADNVLPQATQPPENESDNACLGGILNTDNAVPLEQSCVANHNNCVKLFLADQKAIVGIGPSNDMKQGLTSQNAPVNASSENQSDSVEFPHKNEPLPLEDSPHSSSHEVAMKPSTTSGHANDFVSSTNHEDGLADGQNAVRASATVIGRLPTIGVDRSNNMEERTFHKSVDKEQTEYIFDLSTLNQSIPAGPQSNTESSTPLPMQLVQGHSDVYNKSGKLEGKKHFT